MIRDVKDVEAEMASLLRTSISYVTFLDDDGYPINYILSMFKIENTPEEKGKYAVGTIASSNKVRYLKKHNKVTIGAGSLMKYSNFGRFYATVRVMTQKDYNGALQKELWFHKDPVHKDLTLGDCHYSKHFVDHKDDEFVVLIFDITRHEFPDVTAYRFAPLMGLHENREEQLAAQKKWEEENNQPFPPYRVHGLTV